METTNTLIFFTAFIALLFANAGCGQKKSEGKIEWIGPNEIQMAPIMHDKLSDGQLKRIEAIYSVFDGIDGQTIEKWIEDFRRDLDPNPNILIWENMASTYRDYLSSRNLSQEEKWDVYRVILVRTMVPEDEVLNRIELSALGESEVKEVLKHYKWKAEPITVFEVK